MSRDKIIIVAVGGGAVGTTPTYIDTYKGKVIQTFTRGKYVYLLQIIK